MTKEKQMDNNPVSFSAVLWDTRMTCPKCHRYMSTNGVIYISECGYTVPLGEYDPRDVNITLDVDNIVIKTQGNTKS